MEQQGLPTVKNRAAYHPPRAAIAAWLIARQEGGGVLRSRANALLGAFMVALLPALLVLITLRPVAARAAAAGDERALGVWMALNLLVVGLLPITLAVMAAGNAFAGEHEGGSLAPLLATPASNGAIFAGKVLGALGPTLVYGAAAQVGYALAIAAFLGPARLRLMPPSVALSMVLLTPLVALFGIAVASIISSRVRTQQEAQQYGSLLLLPIWLGLAGVTAKLQTWGVPTLFIATAGLAVADVLLVALGAATWRREEVMARR